MDSWEEGTRKHRHDTHDSNDVDHDNYSWEIKDRNLIVPNERSGKSYKSIL